MMTAAPSPLDLALAKWAPVGVSAIPGRGGFCKPPMTGGTGQGLPQETPGHPLQGSFFSVAASAAAVLT